MYNLPYARLAPNAYCYFPLHRRQDACGSSQIPLMHLHLLPFVFLFLSSCHLLWGTRERPHCLMGQTRQQDMKYKAQF